MVGGRLEACEVASSCWWPAVQWSSGTPNSRECHALHLILILDYAQEERDLDALSAGLEPPGLGMPLLDALPMWTVSPLLCAMSVQPQLLGQQMVCGSSFHSLGLGLF